MSVRRYSAQSYSRSTPFTVDGGPFAKAQTMGWHITNERGFTVGVSCDHKFCDRLNALEELVDLLRRKDALHHLRERADQGCMEDFTEEERKLLDGLLGSKL